MSSCRRLLTVILAVALAVLLIVCGAACAPAGTGQEGFPPEHIPGFGNNEIPADPPVDVPASVDPNDPNDPSGQGTTRDPGGDDPAATGDPGEPQPTGDPGDPGESGTTEPGSTVTAGEPSTTQPATTQPATTQPGTAQPGTAQPPATQPPAPQPPSEPVVLTIRGNGVSGETTWTLDQLKDLTEGYREVVYSTTNSWPSFGHTTAHGVSLRHLMRQAGMIGSPGSFKLISSDGYNITVTYDQIFGTRYAYSTHGSGGSSGARAVEPVLSWSWGDDGRVMAENLRPFFGQRGPMEVNTSAFVKDLIRIEVSTASPGVWAAPGVSVASGSNVEFGTELYFLHDSMDNLTIYYTTDGSEPDYTSRVFNRSASYFQPQLNTPVFLAEDVIIKAFAAGIGRLPSPVVTFSYTVEDYIG